MHLYFKRDLCGCGSWMFPQPAAILQYICSWGGNKHIVLEKEESVKDTGSRLKTRKMACYLKQCWVIASVGEYGFKYEWEI